MRSLANDYVYLFTWEFRFSRTFRKSLAVDLFRRTRCSTEFPEWTAAFSQERSVFHLSATEVLGACVLLFGLGL